MTDMPISPPPHPRRPPHVALWFSASQPPAELTELLATNGIKLARATNEAELERALGSGDHVDIIVPFSRMADLEPFTQVAKRALMPEDRDFGIAYATVGNTPDDWAMPPDPRPFGNPRRLAARFGSGAWRETAETLRQWGQEARLVGCVGRKPLQVVEMPGVSLEAWHVRLLRAAFRGCKQIMVSRGRQGYSGSLLVRVQAIDCDGGELPDFMAKAFPNRNAAAEITHFQGGLRQKLAEGDFSDPDALRLVAGEGCSMLVSRLVAGPGGEVVTLRDLFESSASSVPAVIDRLVANLRRVFRAAQPSEYSIAKAYLANLLPQHLDGLNAELRLMCWQGISAEPDPLVAFLAWLDGAAGKASKSGSIHGDLHCDNVVIRADGELKPVLIDFAHTQQAHAVADLAALAADILVRVVPPILGRDHQMESAQVMCGQKPASSLPDRTMLLLRDAASEHLACGTKEFAGAVLCRILWIIPRATDAEDRKSLRGAADALHRVFATM